MLEISWIKYTMNIGEFDYYNSNYKFINPEFKKLI